MNLRDLVAHALAEDIGPGDVTTEATVPADATATARILAKQTVVVAGHTEAQETFRQLGARYTAVVAEGSEAERGTVIAELEGPARALLMGERVALNFLMRLSGIATHTRAVVAGAGELRVVDTRKTTPLHRASERRAVRFGGGHNHRFALFDGVLIKENHIRVAGGITRAVSGARVHNHHLMRIEVEVTTLAELDEAIDAGADAVLLDNMDDAQLEAAIERGKGKLALEASGNMDAARIARLRDIGLDLVSMGGLVHQARWVDLSMQVEIS